MLGVGGIFDRRTAGPPIKLGRAHAIWLAFVFLWSIQFWCWEFRFSEIVTEWTLGLYLFLVTYALGLLLLSVILVPRTWDGVTDLNEYLYRATGPVDLVALACVRSRHRGRSSIRETAAPRNRGGGGLPVSTRTAVQ
jgi:hypothetical protein